VRWSRELSRSYGSEKREYAAAGWHHPAIICLRGASKLIGFDEIVPPKSIRHSSHPGIRIKREEVALHLRVGHQNRIGALSREGARRPETTLYHERFADLRRPTMQNSNPGQLAFESDRFASPIDVTFHLSVQAASVQL
jgi:hypothetical protein